jgi:hypothetical protein
MLYIPLAEEKAKPGVSLGRKATGLAPGAYKKRAGESKGKIAGLLLLKHLEMRSVIRFSYFWLQEH